MPEPRFSADEVGDQVVALVVEASEVISIFKRELLADDLTRSLLGTWDEFSVVS